MTHESGCGRCVLFAVDHNGGALGWVWVLVRFALHRWSGQCRRMRARLRNAAPATVLTAAMPMRKETR